MRRRSTDNTLETQHMTAVAGYALCSTLVKAICAQCLAGTRPFCILWSVCTAGKEKNQTGLNIPSDYECPT